MKASTLVVLQSSPLCSRWIFIKHYPTGFFCRSLSSVDSEERHHQRCQTTAAKMIKIVCRVKKCCSRNKQRQRDWVKLIIDIQWNNWQLYIIINCLWMQWWLEYQWLEFVAQCVALAKTSPLQICKKISRKGSKHATMHTQYRQNVHADRKANHIESLAKLLHTTTKKYIWEAEIGEKCVIKSNRVKNSFNEENESRCRVREKMCCEQVFLVCFEWKTIESCRANSRRRLYVFFFIFISKACVKNDILYKHSFFTYFLLFFCCFASRLR